MPTHRDKPDGRGRDGARPSAARGESSAQGGEWRVVLLGTVAGATIGVVILVGLLVGAIR